MMDLFSWFSRLSNDHSTSRDAWSAFKAGNIESPPPSQPAPQPTIPPESCGLLSYSLPAGVENVIFWKFRRWHAFSEHSPIGQKRNAFVLDL